LFLATADGHGRPNCSYKGGDPGFVRVIDERSIAFPSYDGNGMYLSAGNLFVNPHVGLLFINFEERKRLRLNGVASFNDDDPLLAEYPEAQLIVRVLAEQVFSNCPRYIHEYRLVARSPSCRERHPRRRCRSGSSRVGRATRYPAPTPRGTRTARRCTEASSS